MEEVSSDVYGVRLEERPTRHCKGDCCVQIVNENLDTGDSQTFADKAETKFSIMRQPSVHAIKGFL